MIPIMPVSLVLHVFRFRCLADLSRWRTLGFLAHAIDQSQGILLIRAWLLLFNPYRRPFFAQRRDHWPGASCIPRAGSPGSADVLPEASARPTIGPFSPQAELT